MQPEVLIVNEDGSPAEVEVVDGPPPSNEAQPEGPQRLRREVLRAYTVSEDHKRQLKALAASGCFACRGTGIQGWKHGGMTAITCRCIRKAAAKLEGSLTKASDTLLDAVERKRG
jgi:hypothetical protein